MHHHNIAEIPFKNNHWFRERSKLFMKKTGRNLAGSLTMNSSLAFLMLISISNFDEDFLSLENEQ